MIKNTFTEKYFDKDFCYTYFNSLKNGVVIVDENGLIQFVNQSYSNILGLPPRKLVGEHMKKIAPSAIAFKSLETKNTYIHQRTIAKLEGNRKIEAFVSTYPIINDDNNCIAVVCIIEDTINNTSEWVKEHSHIISALKNNPINSEVIGNNSSFLKIKQKACRAAKSNASVLLLGESGTGKEIFTEIIHRESNLKGPLVKINCSSIPETLLESEIFGYESGAFTGSRKEGKIGKMELANGGTLFLDEIGDLPPSLQPKLLRALETGTFEKVGGIRPIESNFRLICATNKDIWSSSTFRKDLLFRISTIPIKLPALRERADDIIPLTNYFLEFYNSKYNRSVKLDTDVYNFLVEYKWPGNIRQLKNTIEYIVIMTESNIAQKVDLPSFIIGQGNKQINTFDTQSSLNIKDTQKELEKDIIQKALIKYNYNKSKAISELGISRYTFYKKVKIYGIDI